MNLIADMQELLLSIDAVVAPILTYLPEKTIEDTEVIQRVVFDTAGQDINVGPYVVYSGPFAYDTGLYSGGACGQKRADFWISCYHDYPADAYEWALAIETALIDKFPNTVPLYFFTGQEGTRFTSWLPKAGSMRKLAQDQPGMTGQETPLVGYIQAFQVGWQ